MDKSFGGATASPDHSDPTGWNATPLVSRIFEAQQQAEAFGSLVLDDLADVSRMRQRYQLTRRI